MTRTEGEDARINNSVSRAVRFEGGATSGVKKEGHDIKWGFVGGSEWFLSDLPL